MKALNIFLLAALAAAVSANFAVRPNPALPNREFLPEMVHSVAYESFSANPQFPDGKTLQTPPPGTLMHDAERARPITPERGEFVFRTFCVACHGGAGKGDGPVAMRGFPPPPSLLAPHALELSDAQILDIVSRGQKNMPSYAGQISVRDRQAAVLYVRALQGKAGQP